MDRRPIADRAVLVLFDERRANDAFRGRAEHVISGRYADFTNETELLAFLRTLRRANDE